MQSPMGCWLLALLTVGIVLGEFEKSSSDAVVNPHPFKYLRNNENICSDDTELLIWIQTAPDHIRHRLLIRQTWGNPCNHRDYKTALVFFLGATHDSKTQSLISYESQQYGDIVQGSFVDSYRNLTYKAIHGAKWTSTYCRSVKLVLKADDDVIVDIFQFFNHPRSPHSRDPLLQNTLLCNLMEGTEPLRDEGKWGVTKEEYPGDSYPTYCSGLFAVITADLIPKLYNASLYERFFWVDDVYFTGILAARVGPGYIDLGETVNLDVSTSEVYMADWNRWLIFHMGSRDTSVILWETIVSRAGHSQGRP